MGIFPAKVLGSILSGVFCEIFGKFVTKKFLSKSVDIVILNLLKYLKKKDLIKDSALDDELIELAIETLEDKYRGQ